MAQYQYISQLARDTAERIVSSEENWKKYLDTAARLYRYPFQDQLLIYAQRPDASACASIKIWNRPDIDCRVKRGAKGIALILEGTTYPKLHYVFDISDVYSRGGKLPDLWSYKPEHTKDIFDSFHQFLAYDGECSMEDLLYQIAERSVQEHFPHIIRNFISVFSIV